jgi:hypothetical protein
MVSAKRTQLEGERAYLPQGEKAKRPTDLLGALVAGQMSAEEEDSRLTAKGGLTEEEVIGNVCELEAQLEPVFLGPS